MKTALQAFYRKISGCLTGGAYYAHFDRGEEYCVLSDVAVVAHYLLKNESDLQKVRRGVMSNNPRIQKAS